MPRQLPDPIGRVSNSFLPALHEVLINEKILGRPYFHVSDEPGGEAVENYRKARALLRKLA
jgi:hypothetical protein